MEGKESRKDAGIGEEGGTIKVRNAVEADIARIKDELKKNAMEVGDLDYHEFVVAVENEHVAGFGRLRKTGGFSQIGCVVVLEEKRSRGIGSRIVQHLMQFSPVNVVYIPSDLEEYFAGLGFEKMAEGSKELYDALDEACGVKGRPNTTIMVYEKPGPASG